MKRFAIALMTSVAVVPCSLAQGAAEPAELDALRKELRELRQRTEQLERRLQQYEQQAKPPPSALPPAAPPPAAPDAPAPADATDLSRRWAPADPIRLLGNDRNYLNLSFTGLFAAGASTAEDIEVLQPGAHDPNQRGFTVQNLETTFSGAVDPYFRAQASLIFQIDREGESFLEVEEAYAETMALPGNLQVRAGQFFTEFGRLNPQHPHTWDFVDQPLVNARFLGGDGLRNPGVRLSWLVPMPFYSELFFAVQNSQGETAASFRNENEGEPLFGRIPDAGRVRSAGDLLFVPRYAAAFDLTESQTIVAGVSAAFGPNSTGGDTDTQIYGADVFWKWKPVTHHAGFPFVTFQTEAMLRRYEAGAFAEDLDGNGLIDPGEPDLNEDGIADALGRETLTDYGFYAQVVYGFRKGWTTGLRYGYVASRDNADYELLYGPDPLRSRRWRLSPNITWYPSEFSKLRLQYNLDERERIGTDHTVWLQFEFILGAHAAHRF